MVQIEWAETSQATIPSLAQYVVGEEEQSKFGQTKDWTAVQLQYLMTRLTD